MSEQSFSSSEEFSDPLRSSFTPTWVTYPTSDPLGPILALSSLLPFASFTAMLTLVVVRRDLRCVYLTSGFLFTAASCSALKRLIASFAGTSEHHARPADTELESGGMPSNHSAVAGYLATFALLFALRRGAGEGPSPSGGAAGGADRSATAFAKRWFVPLATLAVSILCAVSRIRLGHHTKLQVVVGFATGTLSGIFFYGGYELVYVPYLAEILEGIRLLEALDFVSLHDVGDVAAWTKRQRARESRSKEKAG